MDNIKEMRELLNLTQAELAKMAGIDIKTLATYENGDGKKINIRNKILEALKMGEVETKEKIQKYNVTDKLHELKKAHTAKNMQDLANKLNVSKNTFNTWRFRNKIPSKYTETNQAGDDNGYWITKISHPASAGTGSDIQDLVVDDMNIKFFVPATFFKTVMNSERLRIVKVDGNSMIPMLYPDSWVIIELGQNFSGDGLYVINYRNILMVKLLQILPSGAIFIKSVNKEYESYEVSKDDQNIFIIVGKVLRSII